MTCCFVFVCQDGDLAIQASLLAASLVRHLPAGHDLVAAVPEPESRWGTVDPAVLGFLEELGVRTVPITNTIDESYPIGNKVSCLRVATDADRIVFLDTDILCMRGFDPDSLPAAPFAAKPADGATFTSSADLWGKVYRLFDLPVPARRMVSTVTRQEMPPYFNAGVVVSDRDAGLGDVWEETCRIIDAAPDIEPKRPWLDQIALPVAVARLGLEAALLDEESNFPAHVKAIPQTTPVLCHYHWPEVARREPRLNGLILELASQHPPLVPIMRGLPAWANLLEPYRMLGTPEAPLVPSSDAPFAAEVLITGIPRSGTSHLCRLLHQVQDCVVINEPTQIFEPLRRSRYPWKVATFHQEIRRDVLDRVPIENRVHHGELVEDSAETDVRSHYLPEVSRPDFLVATKNTMSYLPRIEELREVFPSAAIVACVRNPLESIASWKATFPHLRDAAVTTIPVGHVNDPFLAPWQRERLAAVAEVEDLARRRALLWAYLAECVKVFRAELTVVRYEDLVARPAEILENLLESTPHAPPFRLLAPIEPSVARSRIEILDEADFAAITEICGPPAAEFGYDLDSAIGH